jgi:hypothetical protein
VKAVIMQMVLIEGSGVATVCCEGVRRVELKLNDTHFDIAAEWGSTAHREGRKNSIIGKRIQYEHTE